jgi:hypothetical protein
LRAGILIALFFSFNVYSADAPKTEEKSLVEEWRPTITKFFGESFATRLLGKSPELKKIVVDIQMPAIPQIKSDAKSTEVYNKKPDKIILKPEDEEKYHFSFLEEIYDVTRQTKPKPEDFNKMMNTLNQGATREGVYHSMVLDATYAQLEALDKPVKTPAVEFAIYFYKMYIAKNIAADSLNKMNMYTLKRLIAEKAIEMIDAFGDNRNDMEKWYAILSSDLATRFPQHWNNALRRNTSKAIHKNWASKAPVQHIKSEIVIKIHMALNSLM